MNNIFEATLFNKRTKVWSGVHKPMIFNPKMSLGRAILYMLDKNPDFVAQISDNSAVRKTNREIHDETLKIAANLQKIGCSQGDVVGFLSRNNEKIASAVLAAFLLAAPINALDFQFSKDEIVHMFGITRPKFIFCEREKVDLLREALGVLKINPKIIVFGAKLADLLHIDDLLVNHEELHDFRPPEVDSKTCAVIICSSGTTGLSKGVSLSSGSLLFQASYGFTDEVERPASIICFSSIYWYSGLLTLLMGSLTGITRIITTDPFTPDLYHRMILEYRPKILFTGPLQLSEILNHKLLDESTMDSVKYYVCVGSALPESLWKTAKKYLRNGSICNGYGMSEVGFLSREPPRALKYSAGYLMAGIQVKILDDNGEKLGIGEEGELCVKWEHMSQGYYNNPEETAKTFDKEGWVHSGDIGCFDEDGLLRIVGRSKDILKYNNFGVAPIEIENLILSIPGVLQAVVIGVPHPVSIDLPAAVVVRQDGSSVTAEEISSLIEKNLSDPKRLRGGIYFVDSVPVTPSGKVKKNLVKEMATKLYKERNTNN